MSDPTAGGPSEEELRAYLETLRNAQPVEVVVQSFGILATASDVKVGQPDARVLIDGMAALLDATASRLPDAIVKQMRDTVSQLQMAQVQAEKQASTAGPAGEADQPGPQDRPTGQEAPTDPRQAGQAQQPPQQPRQESPASRLWIPGRD